MKKYLYKDERGIGHALVIFLVVAVLAAIGLVGWRVMDKNKTSTVSTVIIKTDATQASCLKVYHDTKLCKFASANANFKKLAYTAVDNSTDAQGQTSQITIKSDGKGNSSISSKSGNQTYNTITLGSTVYIQNGSSWIEYKSNAPTVANPASDLISPFSSSSTPLAQQVKYKSLGTDKCGTATCFKYQVTDPANAGTNYIWINTSTYRLQQWYSKSSLGTNDFTITYGPVTITAPSPVTTATSADNTEAQNEAQAAQQAAQQSAAQYSNRD